MADQVTLSGESVGVAYRRRAVANYIAQRVTDAVVIARAIGGGVSAEVIELDIKELKAEWRRERRGKLEEVGDSTLRALDSDEAQLRGMLQAARKEGNAKLGTALKLMDMVRETQKLRLQLAGLLSTEGLQSFRSGSGSSGSEGEDGIEDGVFRLYGDEVEGGVVGKSGSVEGVKGGVR